MGGAKSRSCVLCLPWYTASAVNVAPEQLPESLALVPTGTWVRLTGLQAAQHLNDKLGEVVGFDAGKARYKVRLFAKGIGIKLVQEQHLQRAVVHSEGPPVDSSHFI